MGLCVGIVGRGNLDLVKACLPVYACLVHVEGLLVGKAGMK